MWVIPIGTSYALKKNQVKSPSIWSRVPETDLDPSIGWGREPGHVKFVSEPRFRRVWKTLRLRMYLHSKVLA